jgi:hypothetical protein
VDAWNGPHRRVRGGVDIELSRSPTLWDAPVVAPTTTHLHKSLKLKLNLRLSGV